MIDMGDMQRMYIAALRTASRALSDAADHLEAGRYVDAALATAHPELLSVVKTLYMTHRLYEDAAHQFEILNEAEAVIDSVMAPKERDDA